MAGFSMTVINYKSIRSQAFPPRGCGWSSCAGPIPFGLGSLAPRSPLRRRPIGGSGWPSSPGRLALRPASAESACRRGPGRRRCRRAFAPGSVCASGRTCPGSQKAGRPGPGQGSAGRSVPCMSVPLVGASFLFGRFAVLGLPKGRDPRSQQDGQVLSYVNDQIRRRYQKSIPRSFGGLIFIWIGFERAR